MSLIQSSKERIFDSIRSLTINKATEVRWGDSPAVAGEANKTTETVTRPIVQNIFKWFAIELRHLRELHICQSWYSSTVRLGLALRQQIDWCINLSRPKAYVRGDHTGIFVLVPCLHFSHSCCCCFDCYHARWAQRHSAQKPTHAFTSLQHPLPHLEQTALRFLFFFIFEIRRTKAEIPVYHKGGKPSRSWMPVSCDVFVWMQSWFWR